MSCFNHCHNWLCLAETTAMTGYACGLRWCSNSSKFVTDNSSCIRRFFYNRPHWPLYHKYKQKHLAESRWTSYFHPWRTRLRYMCVLRRHVASTVFNNYQYLNLTEGAYNVFGHAQKSRVPLQWRNQFWQN